MFGQATFLNTPSLFRVMNRYLTLNDTRCIGIAYPQCGYRLHSYHGIISENLLLPPILQQGAIVFLARGN